MIMDTEIILFLFRLTKELAEFARAQVERHKQELSDIQSRKQAPESDDDDIEVISETASSFCSHCDWFN